MKIAFIFYTAIGQQLGNKTVNPLIHNIPKWSDTLWSDTPKWPGKCCKINKVCLTILRHYALKGQNHENSFPRVKEYKES